MNRPRAIENYRTVTEISDSAKAFQKRYDVSALVNKNESYIRNSEKRNMVLMVSKYISMFVDRLKVPDLRSVFSGKGKSQDVISVVYNSLAFVNNQVHPHANTFADMNFIILNERKYCIPGEPIVFYRNINQDEDQTVMCYVDRPSILRILEKPIDVNIIFEEEDCNTKNMTRLVERIKLIEKQRCTNVYTQNMQFAASLNEFNLKMDETYVTQFVTLLVLFSNAYLGYYKLIRTDFPQYLNFIINHDGIEHENFLTNLRNLFIAHFKFSVAAEYEKRNNSGFIVKQFE
ncbi:ORF112 [Xestia c-nigrum granulovirus]|uniref:Ac144 homolog n=1 Tax=Xestia c-nigrum granulosis virus TaxID=51677 RepID=P89277_GVXN|nr:ORF112 [Xestia c-nigrum granulovirus]AAC06332.1 Ac144 homolog [Xestia c-nigrum granulovirus]AAF05226.1 ORF112 [Xestia c-nigrum granulovirus]